MPFSALAVANEFLDLDKNLSPMKLQKLVYYAHGWYLALADQPLISERVEAWQYGPVIPALYSQFRRFGNEAITEKARELCFRNGKIFLRSPSLADCEDASDAKQLIARVNEEYGKYSAAQLSNATHKSGTPWQEVYRDGARSIAIPDEKIKDYFKKMMQKGIGSDGQSAA